MMGNAYTIETERLVLRKTLPYDFDDFSKYYGDAEVAQWLLGHNADDAAIAAAFSFNLGLDTCFSVVLKCTERVIGNVHFVNVTENYLAEIGYVLCPEHWGRGLMTEAVLAAVDYAFNKCGFMRLRAITEAHNDASAKVLRRCGFMHEATIYEAAYGGRVADVCYYSRITLRTSGQ